MAHEIETYADGSAAFASARVDAWHRLGVVTTDCMTAQEVMVKARLGGWRVRKISLTGHEITADGVSPVEIPDRFATVRTNPVTGATDYLGVVGLDWRPFQNEEAAELLNVTVDEAGAHFETAGSLRGGRQVFITMKLPKHIMVGGVDRVDLFLAALNGHDGSRAIRVMLTPTRIVCANTQQIAMHDAVAAHALRHTKNVGQRVQEVREALRLVWRAADDFQAAAERMINATLVVDEFEQIVDRVWPAKAGGGQVAERNRTERKLQLVQLLTQADTQAAIRGTRWAGYQAIAEYVDHFSAKTAQAAALQVLTSSVAKQRKERAWELLAV
jgi:phage/plasmid-like protein (TIGR03299 family)